MTEKAKQNLATSADMALVGLQTYARAWSKMYTLATSQHFRDAWATLDLHNAGIDILDDPADWLDLFDLIAEVKLEIEGA